MALSLTTSDPTVIVTAEFPLHCADAAALQNVCSPVVLGPLDQRSLLSIPLAAVFVYRQKPEATRELIPVDRLRAALSRLLNYYPHLTGRIVINPKDQAPQIEQIGAGAKLVVAQCSEPLKTFESSSEDDEPGSAPRLMGANLPGGGNALVPPFDPTEAGAARDAILTAQHTRFACGGVSVALRLRHIVCDAAGFFQLARDMAELYRGLQDLDEGRSTDVRLSNAPDIHSYLAGLQMSLEEKHQALQIKPTLFELAPELLPPASSETGDTSNSPPIIGRVLRFSSNELAAIKTEANAGNNGRPVSTFCALAAHLWQSIYRARVHLCEARGTSPSEAEQHVPRQFLASADLRRRGQLNVSPRYFPNCVLCPVFSLCASELRTAPLSIIAVAVHDGVQPLDPVEVEQNVRWIVAQPDKQRVRLRYRYEEGGVMVSQWNKFGMYRGTELDVPPALVAQPFTPISLADGLMYFMATEDQLGQSECSKVATTGSIDVSLALSEPVWAILEHDARFRQHRGW
ncbi:Omega-hydroxypalmitate O-feruloyl transferase [Phytophthora cinnamomi]|uniref:Omega-hydroxypalmitate O-feruloyl transferase n=1 Tax=Phytophthora cinnamomi TaxID=4785 RepID=UPI00355943B2|nr:Omega-hydroxypalmitate O-feruloyl transferase [Phytophthora cinnamomi]